MKSDYGARPAGVYETLSTPMPSSEPHSSRVVTVSLLLLAGSIVLTGQSLQDSELAARIQVLDASIQATVVAEELPGLSVGLVHDQDLIWAKSYGFADLEKKIPASPATLYRMASVTKVFTATAIMQLRDAGKLHLDDPVAKHLAWFTPKDPFPNSPAITVWDLMTHTAGLGELGAPAPTQGDLIRLLRETEVVLPPETEYRYENLNYRLLGEMIAAVSGEPYAVYMERHILRPLGMNASRFREQGTAVGYRRPRRGMPYQVAPFSTGTPIPSNEQTAGVAAGGLYSSIEDLARFASLQFRDSPVRNSQILKGSTLREMQRVHWLRPGWQSGAGLGWELIERVREQIRVGHQGGSTGWMADLVIAPEDKLAVIVLVNAAGFETSERQRLANAVSRRILDLAFEAGGRAVTVAAEVLKLAPAPETAWRTYVGTYAGRRIMVINGLLTIISPLAATPWSSRETLQLVAPHTFRVLRSGSPYGELVRFEVDQNGRATGLRFADAYWPRQ